MKFKVNNNIILYEAYWYNKRALDDHYAKHVEGNTLDSDAEFLLMKDLETIEQYKNESEQLSKEICEPIKENENGMPIIKFNKVYGFKVIDKFGNRRNVKLKRRKENLLRVVTYLDYDDALITYYQTTLSKFIKKFYNYKISDLAPGE